MNNFSDILDRNFPLWKIEMLFQTIKISKFWGGGVAFPHNPLMACIFSACKIRQWLKNVPILLTQKVGQSVWVQDIIVGWRSVQAFTGVPLPIQIGHEYFIQLVNY